jgi:hypothetical protein
MRFHFCTLNHNGPGKETLGDMYDWFAAGLADLGHTVSRGDDLDTGAMNLLWDNFRAGMGAALRQSGVRYGIVATELPDGEGGFNWRRDSPWPERFAAFPEVAQGASFIWSMIESAQPYYARFAPCAFIELGYSDRLLPPSAVRRMQPPVDFGFYGLRTPYRAEVMAALEARGVRVAWPERLPDTAAIQAFIATTRIGLNFRQSDRWPIPSPTRLGRYLHARRLLVSEHTKVPTRQGELVHMAPPEADFIAWCLRALTLDWKSAADQAFERYRTTMPMAGIMEQVLDATLPHAQRKTAGLERRITPDGLTVEPAPGDIAPPPWTGGPRLVEV